MRYFLILYYFHYDYCHHGQEIKINPTVVYNKCLRCPPFITTVVLVNYSVVSTLMYSQNLLSQSIHLMMKHSSQMMKGYVHLMSMPPGMTTVSCTVYVLNSFIKHTHLHCRRNLLVRSTCSHACTSFEMLYIIRVRSFFL